MATGSPEVSAKELAEIKDILGDPEVSRDVSAEELAEWIGLTPSRIHTLGREGTIPRNVDKTYPLRRAVLAYAEHARQGALGRRADGELAQEKIRLARATAEKLETANLKAKGELAPLTDVEKAWAGILRDIRAALLALPSRAASRLGHLTPHDVATIDREVRAVLEELASHD
jgi:phage terminase Nu1 subunit (DNA packaging protein)